MENMATFAKKRTSLRGAVVLSEDAVTTRFRAEDVLDDRKPMRVPVQAVQRRISSPGPDTSCKVLPLPSVYGLSIEVVNPATQEARCLMRKVGRREIVEEVYPIEGMRFRRIR